MDPFIGSILLVPYTYLPHGWLPCVGTLLPIQEYDALFVLFGTTYGGNGSTNFALPDLQNICPSGMMYIIAYTGFFPSQS
jgi:microcystin-dependent protein